MLAEAAKFCEQGLTPLNRTGDAKAARRHGDGSVTTPKGFKEAFKQYVEGGWMGISAPAEFGGQGLPEALTVAVNEMMALGQHGLRHVSGPDPGRDRRADPRTARPSRRRPICRRWSRAAGPAP